ncbi:Vesicle trafficking between the ER and Golgi [Geranomyces variabilis]|uniref:Vesicle trafficking between the ER and Golgi n=1 Tax=Geranomyces variabilis TaxID=109894 RepID=A0AAD5TGT9_9FUNG|nr:Vesicle trafficking between the ER and Golgi [Geranomyces variabilis]
MTASKSLRDLQKDALFAMFSLNAADTSTDSNTTSSPSSSLATNGASTAAATALAITDPVWKVLIYDRFAQDVISPIVKVNDLREMGVTVHMPLYSDRLPIPDVPAIYFMQPTAENIRRMGEDLSKRLYESYYINFSSTIPRPLLEDLASTTIQAGASAEIAQVFDQYLDYVCLDHNLFSFQMEDSYRLLNDPSSSESHIEKLLDRIVGSLFSVLVTMSAVPVIRAQRGNAAEVVATKLEAKLRDHLLNSRANLFSTDAGAVNRSIARPVLIILDRNLDLNTMLSHTWTYATLVHDIFDMKLNRVTIPDPEAPAGAAAAASAKRKTFDIDVNDFFWKRHSANPFPQVAEDVDVEINKYKADVDQVTRSCGVSSLEDVDPNEYDSGAKGLTTAINKLPELTERKRLLDMHMSIATGLLKTIQERHLDQFFAMEESITRQTKATISEALRDTSKSPADKIRLFSIYYLSVDTISKDDLAEYERLLVEAGCSVAAIGYLKQVRAISRMTASANVAAAAAAPTTAATDLLYRFSTIGSKLTDHLQSTGVGNHFENLVSGVKNLLPVRKDCPVTRVVDTMMENRDEAGGGGGNNAANNPGDVVGGDYLYLDPRLPRGSSGKPAKGRTAFGEAVVFVVGGGNYLEAQNLWEYTQRTSLPRKKITYGTTELLTPNAFMAQLETLGGGGAGASMGRVPL